ncbi:MAG: L-rhamnose mutarotase [Rhodoglobus sp.]|nr:L-rhamnose mutarotase [Rhodoglobus sp.]
MQRVCFQLQVKPALIEEYRERHEAVPADMLAAIEESGRRNYSLFLREDGLLIGYFETDSLEESARYLAEHPVATAWEAEAAHYFEAMAGRPDQSFVQLTEVFNLEDQIANAKETP